MVLPPADAVINQLVTPVGLREPLEREGEVSGNRNEYAIPPSQLLQRTLQESMEWTEEAMKDPSANYAQGLADACSEGGFVEM